MTAVHLDTLRQTIGAIEGAQAGPAGMLATGADRFDAALGGGLPLGAATTFEATAPLDEAAADALALSCAALAAGTRGGDVVIVQDRGARALRGRVYGPGLGQLGLPASRVLLVTPRSADDTRACIEEAARTPGLAAVVGLLGPQAGFGLVPARRVQLAAEEACGLVLLACGLRTAPFLPARVRLSVRPAAGSLPGWARDLPAGSGLPPPGLPAWRADIIRARGGGRGSFILENPHEAGSGTPARTAIRLREPPAVADRPDRAGGQDSPGWPPVRQVTAA